MHQGRTAEDEFNHEGPTDHRTKHVERMTESVGALIGLRGTPGLGC